MKILTLTFFMSTLCVALSYAQQDQKMKALTPEDRAAKRIEMMKKSLDLTNEQVVKLQEAQKQLSENMNQVQAKNEANREEMKAKRAAYNEQLKTILTPEQYQKYQDQRKEMHQNQSKKMRKGSKGGFQKGQFGNHQAKETEES